MCEEITMIYNNYNYYDNFNPSELLGGMRG